MYVDRFIAIFDTLNYKLLYKGKIAGSGAILSMTMRDEFLYLSPSSRKLLEINTSGDKLNLPENIYTDIRTIPS